MLSQLNSYACVCSEVQSLKRRKQEALFEALQKLKEGVSLNTPIYTYIAFFICHSMLLDLIMYDRKDKFLFFIFCFFIFLCFFNPQQIIDTK